VAVTGKVPSNATVWLAGICLQLRKSNYSSCLPPNPCFLPTISRACLPACLPACLQLGGGRTTTGMVIGSLLRMKLNGAQLELGGPGGLVGQASATVGHMDEDVGGCSPRGGSDDDDEQQQQQQGQQQQQQQRGVQQQLSSAPSLFRGASSHGLDAALAAMRRADEGGDGGGGGGGEEAAEEGGQVRPAAAERQGC
jgi:hypothetical protein